LKILASQIWIIFLSATTAMASVPGHGSPQGFEYCEYNAEPVRTHRPSNVVRAEEALEQAEEALERIQADFDEADTCQLECRDTVYRVIELTVGRGNLQEYLDYLGGSFECYAVANSAVRQYNTFAQVYGWDIIREDIPQASPQRMIAEDRVPPTGGGVITIPDDEISGSDPDPRPVDPRPVDPPQNIDCRYMGPNNTLDLSICQAARNNGLTNRQYSQCRRCLGPQNNYGRCLRRMARLEQELYEAQELVEQRERELEEALANPSSRTTCTDCMQDTRNWWERWGPTIATGAVVGLSGYFAYRQERNSYEYYRDVIHENNNRLGYPTEPREDLSGYRLAAHLVNGAPLVINTGLSTGAFGCAGSSMYGMGSIVGGLFGGTQQGGATGYNNSTISGILNGGIGGSIGGGINGGAGQWGTGQPSSAQIDAMIRAQQESIAQQQAQLAAMQQSQSYYQSRAAIEADALARIQALGAPPAAGTGVWAQGQGGVQVGGNSWDPLNGSFWQSGQINGGINVRGQIQTYGNAGIGGVQPLPTGAGYPRTGYPNASPGWPQDNRYNPAPPPRHSPGSGGVDRLPL
jgi:hypothetical protein